jgi:5'(3')-deoxyribonucleotidase
MKNFQIGDILKYNKGEYIINYFLVVDRVEIKSNLHHAGCVVEYKIKNMETEGINIIFSDNKVISRFVRQNDWSI